LQRISKTEQQMKYIKFVIGGTFTAALAAVVRSFT
jgi:hypothetical protein